jgi:HSP20 family protein
VAILASDPFEALLGLQQALDSLRDSNWLAASPSGTGAYPPINVFRKGDDFVIIIEVPGIQKSDLEVQVRGNAVRLTGKKTVDYPETVSLHRRERLTGAFDRTVTIPVEIDPDRVMAECRDGILALFLARAERDKPKSIAITS